MVEWSCYHDPLRLRLCFDDLSPRETTPLSSKAGLPCYRSCLVASRAPLGACVRLCLLFRRSPWARRRGGEGRTRRAALFALLQNVLAFGKSGTPHSAATPHAHPSLSLPRTRQPTPLFSFQLHPHTLSHPLSLAPSLHAPRADRLLPRTLSAPCPLSPCPRNLLAFEPLGPRAAHTVKPHCRRLPAPFSPGLVTLGYLPRKVLAFEPLEDMARGQHPHVHSRLPSPRLPAPFLLALSSPLAVPRFWAHCTSTLSCSHLRSMRLAVSGGPSLPLCPLCPVPSPLALPREICSLLSPWREGSTHR